MLCAFAAYRSSAQLSIGFLYIFCFSNHSVCFLLFPMHVGLLSEMHVERKKCRASELVMATSIDRVADEKNDISIYLVVLT